MEQYIKKSTLVAEIWKRRNKHFNFGGSPSSEYCHEDDEILGIIYSLEVKEVDMNKEIDLVEDKYHGFESLSRADIIDVAKHFFELGMQVSNKSTERSIKLGEIKT